MMSIVFWGAGFALGWLMLSPEPAAA